jgi:hypothetical protein
MAKTLTPTSAFFTSVQPTLDVDNTTLIGLNVTFNLHYTDLTGIVPPVSTAVTVDAWSQLSSQQKTNMQDIRDTIVAYIMSAYFA